MLIALIVIIFLLLIMLLFMIVKYIDMSYDIYLTKQRLEDFNANLSVLNNEIREMKEVKGN